MKLIIMPLLLLSSLHAQEDKVKNFWYSGAEISSFKLEQSQYGEIHPGHTELIFVTEPFLLDKQVKNESNKANSTSVLKLNRLRTFNTGIYSYRTMTSTFRPVDLQNFPHTLKSISTVQDWCGQTFQQANYRDNTWKVELRSYFEGQGDKNLSLPSAYNEDGLWITLRLDPKKLPTGEIDVLPSAIYSRFQHGGKIGITKAKADLKESGKASTYTLVYPDLKRTLTIHFDTDFPHIIRKWTDQAPSGTTTATLSKRLMNSAYWGLHNLKDADKRKQLGLDPVAN